MVHLYLRWHWMCRFNLMKCKIFKCNLKIIITIYVTLITSSFCFLCFGIQKIVMNLYFWFNHSTQWQHCLVTRWSAPIRGYLHDWHLIEAIESVKNEVTGLKVHAVAPIAFILNLWNATDLKKTGSWISRSKMKLLAAILAGPLGVAFFFDDCWNVMNARHKTE